MNINDIPLDVFKFIIDTTVGLCKHAQERADVQKALICVNKRFYCSIIGSPIVSLSEALDVKDQRAANIAIQHLAKHANLKAELLNTPQAVGAALRMRYKSLPIQPNTKYNVYLQQLAQFISTSIDSTFSNIEDIQKYLSPRPEWRNENSGIEIIEYDSLHDDWKTLAVYIVKVHDSDFDTDLLRHMYYYADSFERMNCTRLLRGMLLASAGKRDSGECCDHICDSIQNY
jgi:hypothetical protein